MQINDDKRLKKNIISAIIVSFDSFRTGSS